MDPRTCLKPPKIDVNLNKGRCPIRVQDISAAILSPLQTPETD